MENTHSSWQDLFEQSFCLNQSVTILFFRFWTRLYFTRLKRDKFVWRLQIRKHPPVLSSLPSASGYVPGVARIGG